ncbi:MAG: LolA family protein [Candidatus Anammoxibacter sp.]
MRIFLILLFFLSNFAIYTCFAEQENHDELNYVLKRVSEANKGITSLKADITLTRSIPLLESEEISKGILIYNKPKRFLIKFEPPRNEINIIDGENILIYHVDQKQVEKYAISDMGANSLMDVFTDFGLDGTIDAIKEKYDIRLAGKQNNFDEVNKNKGTGNVLYKLDLKLKSDKSNGNYSGIQLWVHGELWMPVIFELYESNGEILNRIELNNIVLNKHNDVEVFSLHIPEDVVVVEPLK